MRRRLLVLVPTLLVAALLSGASGSAQTVPPSAEPELVAHPVQSELTVHWDVAFTPNGRMLVTERPGRIRVYAGGHIDADLLSTYTDRNVRAERESGMMGLAVGVRGDRTYVFVCASRQDNGLWRNQVLRYRFANDKLTFDRYVVRWGIRAHISHNGCAVAIGPDMKLWVGTGDADRLSLPQNPKSLNGKVLRMNWDGSVPADNPTRGSLVYTSGHRNVQGIAFQPKTGAAFSVEHGPDVNDEINRLRPGGNYGWPCWTGSSTRFTTYEGPCKAASSYRGPSWASGSPTIATSGATFVHGDAWGEWSGDLFVSQLKEEDLRRFQLNDAVTRAYQHSLHFDREFGRLRAAFYRPQTGALFVTTSNHYHNPHHDKVIRITTKPAKPVIPAAP